MDGIAFIIIAGVLVALSLFSQRLPPQVVVVTQQPEPQAGAGCLPVIILVVLVLFSLGLLGNLPF